KVTPPATWNRPPQAHAGREPTTKRTLTRTRSTRRRHVLLVFAFLRGKSGWDPYFPGGPRSRRRKACVPRLHGHPTMERRWPFAMSEVGYHPPIADQISEARPRSLL